VKKVVKKKKGYAEKGMVKDRVGVLDAIDHL
jgi:hypothetical protein